MFKITLDLESKLNDIFRCNHIRLLPSKDGKHGHLSTNGVIRLAKTQSRQAIEIHEELLKKLDLDTFNIKRIEFIEPGFLNFEFEDEWFVQLGEEALAEEKVNVNTLNVELTREKCTRENLICSQIASIYRVVGKEFVETKIKNDRIEPFKISEIELNKLNIAQLAMAACSKNKTTKVKIDTNKMLINDLTNPYKYIVYTVQRADSVSKILISEGYDSDKVNKNYLFEMQEVRNMFVSFLKIEDAINQAVKFNEPYKIYAQLKVLCDAFYRYNNKLLLRNLERQKLHTHLFIMKVYAKLADQLIGVLVNI